LTVLRRLDGERKGHVVQFLYESGLILTSGAIVDLYGADLSSAYLSGANLGGANLSGARLDYAHLEGASLDDTMMPDGDRRMNAPLAGVGKGPIVKGLTADLQGASLIDAHLKGASLRGALLLKANLKGTDLSGAKLNDAKGWTKEQLSEAGSLEGATMPDGQTLRGDETPDGPTFEDWLKARE
jgi:uncharacterized protein YjbI with pentapeptide repeats